jgi:hypothetical protein
MKLSKDTVKNFRPQKLTAMQKQPISGTLKISFITFSCWVGHAA